jgi:hypothetical protein
MRRRQRKPLRDASAAALPPAKPLYEFIATNKKRRHPGAVL